MKMLLPIEPEAKGHFIRNVSVSALILVLGAWAAENQVTIGRLWDRVGMEQAAQAQLHEDQALLRQELKYIEVQLDDLKTIMKEHNKHDDSK